MAPKYFPIIWLQLYNWKIWLQIMAPYYGSSFQFLGATGFRNWSVDGTSDPRATVLTPAPPSYYTIRRLKKLCKIIQIYQHVSTNRIRKFSLLSSSIECEYRVSDASSSPFHCWAILISCTLKHVLPSLHWFIQYIHSSFLEPVMTTSLLGNIIFL